MPRKWQFAGESKWREGPNHLPNCLQHATSSTRHTKQGKRRKQEKALAFLLPLVTRGRPRRDCAAALIREASVPAAKEIYRII